MEVNNKCYPLHTACASGDINQLKDLVSQEGCFVNETNFDLVQPLHEACFKGSLECVRYLLDHGAQVNARNIDGATPLCDACSTGSEACVSLLLEHGANVNPQLLLSSPLHEAVLRDQWECAQLLINAGANLNHMDCHFGTPLHAAVYKGSINSVRVLLKAGCNVNSTAILSTPLHVAARQQHYEITWLLLEAGANPRMINNRDCKAKDTIPSETSPVRKLLVDWECSSRSLKFTARHVIRTCLGPGRLKHLHKIGLPKLLREYVALENT